ncbi:hypothetical protein GCM10009850_038400 [Nonomuraea monospora]|uniref:non-specific serine/threonine protein kinase n=2 Tax=Nonomuraea monospora TaxID=568818 RepID=A0ABP5P9C9_9ACTN
MQPMHTMVTNDTTRVLSRRNCARPAWIGNYRVLGVLGEGGQGRVYLGMSKSMGNVAIKVPHAWEAMDAPEQHRFLREANLVRKLAPFCTATLLEAGLIRDCPYIVSEYIAGPSLRDLVRRDGPRSGSGLHRLAVATLSALMAIHRAGVIHRDIKPANVIMSSEGPVVIDFGIAQLLDHVNTRSRNAGTPSYMAPEQLTERPLSPATDLFAWAATMVFAATGRPAFPGRTLPAVMHSIMTGEPDLTCVPEPLRLLALACLAKDPQSRPCAAQLLSWLTANPDSR